MVFLPHWECLTEISTGAVIVFFSQTGNRRQRPFHQFDDLTNSIVFSFPVKAVTSSFAADTGEKTASY